MVPYEPLELRAPLGELPNVATSAHFAVQWADDGPPEDEDVALLLAALERDRAEEVDARGYPAPTGSDTYYLNVYVGNTGAPAPSIYFDGGFTRKDTAGFAYVVLNRSVVAMLSGDDPYGVGAEDPRSYAEEVVAHELFHTVQFGTGAFPLTNSPQNLWIWEFVGELDGAEQRVGGDRMGHDASLLGHALVATLQPGTGRRGHPQRHHAHLRGLGVVGLPRRGAGRRDRAP